MNPVILIPSRLQAQRFPNKPLHPLKGIPMVLWVLKAAQSANIGPVVVASPDEEILKLVEKHQGVAIKTNPNHPTGTDRIFEALNIFDPQEKFDTVINLQGDMPSLSPSHLKEVLKPLHLEKFSISTLATPLNSPEELPNRNIVKIALSQPVDSISQAFYFSRSPIPHGNGPHFHHVGVYAYRRKDLNTFVRTPQSQLELQEGLEQLRALELGFKIGVYHTSGFLCGVDSPEDVVVVEKHLPSHS